MICRFRYGLLAVGVSLSLLFALESWRVFKAYDGAAAAKEDLLAGAALLAERGLEIQKNELDIAQSRFIAAKDKLQAASAFLDTDPLVSLLGNVPFVDRHVADVRELMEVSLLTSNLGVDLVDAAREFQEVRDNDTRSILLKIPAVFQAMEAELDEIEANLAQINTIMARMSFDGSLGPVTRAGGQLNDRLERLTVYVREYRIASVLAPELIGFNGERTYLILTQDNTELFPTGGLISVYGLLTMNEGRVTGLEFSDVGRTFWRWRSRSVEYVEPPGPLKRHLLRDWSWNLGTSNWSPDFPTAARQAQFFLELETGLLVDGVLGINFITLEELLKAIGPVSLSDYGITVNSSNATTEILERSHSPDALSEGKHVFVAALAEQIIQRTFEAEASELTDLAHSVSHVGRTRQLFLYLNEESLQQAVEQLGWAGELRSPSGDYLMIVDASVHSSKLNLVLHQSINVKLRLDRYGNAWHEVQVLYENRLPDWVMAKDSVLREQMLGGLYGGYVRLFSPKGSTLLSVTRDGSVVGVEEFGHEAERSFFGVHFALPKGEGTELTFSYYSPEVAPITNDVVKYTLDIQKQSGTLPISLDISVEGPKEAHSINITLDDAPIDGTRMMTNIAEDRQVDVTIELR